MILTIIVFVVMLGLIILIHELGHFISGKLAGVKVEEFAIGFPPRLISFKKGETRYSINLIPFGGYVKLLGEDGKSHDSRSFGMQSSLKRFWILVSGVLGNFILAWITITIALYCGSSPIVTDPTHYGGQIYNPKIFIAEVAKDSPASNVGLQFGDIIISAGGTEFTALDQFQNYTQEHQGQKIDLKILRNKKELTKNVTLRDKSNGGALGVVVAEDAKIKYVWWKVPFIALVETVKLVGIIAKLFVLLIKNLFVTGKVPSEVSGPVGIYNLTGQAVGLGFIYLMKFIALLNINIGILNILPFPALDGGRLLFLAIEKFRGGKKINPSVEGLVNSIGFFLLVLMLILITFRDVIKIFRS